MPTISRTTMVDDDGSGTTGTIINNAWKQQFYDQIDLLVAGAWIPIPYNAANFTASNGLWTVTAAMQKTWAYAVVGRVAFFQLYLENTTTTASATSLSLAIPPGINLPLSKLTAPVTYYHPGGGAGTGYLEGNIAVATLAILRDMVGTPWVASSALLIGAQWAYPLA